MKKSRKNLVFSCLAKTACFLHFSVWLGRVVIGNARAV